MTSNTYDIYREDLRTGQVVKVAEGLETTQYEDTDVKIGRQYKYKVTTIADGEKLTNPGEVVILAGDTKAPIRKNENGFYLDCSYVDMFNIGESKDSNNNYSIFIIPRTQLESDVADVFFDVTEQDIGEKASVLLCPSAQVESKILQDTTVVKIKNIFDLDLVTENSLALIDKELVLVKSIDIVTSTITIVRGVVDTVPEIHDEDTLIIFYEQAYSDGLRQVIPGYSVTADYRVKRSDNEYKPLVEPSSYSRIATNRAYKHLSPCNIKINGLYYPPTVIGLITISWDHRVELSDTDILIDWFDSNTKTEVTGVSYTVTVYDENDNTVTMITEKIPANSRKYVTLDLSDYTGTIGRINVTANTAGYDFNAPSNLTAVVDETAVGDETPIVELSWEFEDDEFYAHQSYNHNVIVKPEKISEISHYIDPRTSGVALSWTPTQYNSPVAQDHFWDNVTVLVDVDKNTIKDRSKNNKSLTLLNVAQAVTLPTYSYEYNKAINFGTGKASIKTTTNDVLWIDDFTMEIIIKPTSFDATNGTRLFSVGDYAGSADGGGFMLVTHGDILLLYVYKDSITTAFNVSATIELNVTSHIVLMRKDHRFYAFVNGVIVASSTDTFDYYSVWKTDLIIGADVNNDYAFGGDIYAFRLTEKIARYPVTGFKPSLNKFQSGDQLWTPAQLKAVPNLWISADSVVSDSSNRISQLTDKSGYGLHFMQTTDSYKPILVKDAYNGNPAIRFDGSNDVLYSSNASKSLFRNINKFSIFVVCKRITIEGRDTGVILQSSIGTGSGWRVGIRDRPNGVIDVAVRVNDSTYHSKGIIKYIEDLAIVSFDVDMNIGKIYSYSSSHAEAPFDLLTGNIPDTESMNVLSIGGNQNNDTGYAFKGDLLEMIVVKGETLSEEDRVNLEGWAAHKYGKTRKLIDTHNHKRLYQQIEKPWTPDNLNTSLYLDCNNMTVSNNVVSMITDNSINNNHATGGVAAGLSNINKVPVIKFNGTTQYLNFTNSSLLSSLNGSSAHWVFTVSRSTTQIDGNNIFTIAAGSLAKFKIEHFTSGYIGVGGRRLNSDEWSGIQSRYTVSGKTVMTFGQADHSKTSLLLYIDGLVEGYNYEWLTPGVSDDSANLARIGANTSSSGSRQYSNNSLGCCVFGRGILSGKDREKLEGWAAHKFRLTDSLPDNHPYKNKAPLNLEYDDQFVEYADTFMSFKNTLLDSGIRPKHFTQYNTPILSENGLKFTGSQALLTTEKHNDFAFGTGDFTIEFCAIIIGQGGPVLDMRDIYVDGGTDQYNIFISISPTSISMSDGITVHTISTVFTSGKRYAIAIVRNAGTLMYFIDGVKVLEKAEVSFDSINPRQIVIGATRSTTAYEAFFTGTLSNIRITKGVALYLNNYTITYQKL